MATARDIIKAAMRRLVILAAGEEPNAADAADCLERLNRILKNFEASGCAEVNPQMGLGTDWTAGDQYLQSIEDMLAKRIAPYFGVPVPADLAWDAGAGERKILKAFVTRATFGVDLALRADRMSGTRAAWSSSIEE